MAIVLPQPTDKLGTLFHSHMHNVFAIDGASPFQSVVVDADGNVLMLNGTINISNQLISNTAYGTSPFSVTSNTIVTNLNSDFLDGQHGTYYNTADNLTGTIPAAVLSNSNTFIGTTSISLNRPSANLTISGISVSGISASFSSTTASSNTSTGALIVAGGVGIGGDLNIGGNITTNGATFGSGTSFSSNVTITANTVSTNTSIGALVVAGGVGIEGDIYTGGQLFETSDIRLKSDIELIPNALQKVLNLNGYTFDKNGKKSTGLIAQEVVEIIPEAVSTDDKYLSVSYGNLVGLLIEAIKEQNERINNLENIINNK